MQLAALVLASFRAAAAHPGLAELAGELDHSIRPRLGEEDFVTAVLAQFSRHGQLQLVNCGHPPPLRFRGGTVERLARAEPTTPLGLDPTPTIQRVTLAPTDRVLLYTDGLVEARAPDGRPFELDGQIQAVGAASSLSGALDGLVVRLLDHAGAAWTTTWRWCWPSLAGDRLISERVDGFQCEAQGLMVSPRSRRSQRSGIADWPQSREGNLVLAGEDTARKWSR